MHPVRTADLERVHQLPNAMASNMVRLRTIDLLVCIQFAKDRGAVDVDLERHVFVLLTEISTEPDCGSGAVT